jgi:hypothetical protein
MKEPPENLTLLERYEFYIKNKKPKIAQRLEMLYNYLEDCLQFDDH